MGFLLPALPAIIGAGGAVAGGLLGRGGGGAGGGTSGTVAPPPLSAEEQGLLTKQNTLIDWLSKSGQDLFGLGLPSLQAAQNFWLPILSGDRSKALEVLGPDVDTIAKQYDTARKNILATAPRGGAREMVLSQSRTDEAGDVGRLLATARPMAAQALTGIGGGASQLALGAGQAGTQGISSAMSALSQARNAQNYQGYLDLLRRGQNIGIGTGLGQLAAGLLSKLPFFGGGTNISGVGGSSPTFIPFGGISGMPPVG